MATRGRAAAERARRLIPGLWAGLLLCVALMAAPAAFATLPVKDAGRVAARLFAQEAYVSMAVAVVMLLLERGRAVAVAEAGAGSRLSTPMVLCLVALFFTVAGFYGVQPMMAAARAGQGPWTFGQLHAISMVCFALKAVAVLWLAVRSAGSDAP
jgi:hypothetical protein